MKAAVVHSFDRPPRYEDFPAAIAGPGEVLVTVRATALTQLVKSQASGKHYSSTNKLPIVPGFEGVGQLDNGRRIYFAFPTPPVGSMAERVAVKEEYCVALPDDLDDVTAAAAANPGMSSWAALAERAHVKPGECVLINGATGAAGKLAIQIARHLGASRVVATGRNSSSATSLRALGADDFVPLDLPRDALVASFKKHIEAGVDVVLDYLWGLSAECIIAAATGHGAGEAARRIRYVDIGSIGGDPIALPAGALRSSGLELLGSGLGSVSHVALLRSIAALMHAIVPAKLQVSAEPIPLMQVESAWNGDASGRVVFTL